VPTPSSIARIVALILPGVAAAQQPVLTGRAEAPSGFVVTGSLGGGAELGLPEGASGKAGILEVEVTGGWEIPQISLRPELGAVFGLAPSSHVALRPGIRWTLPDLPIQLRAALDWSTARGETRWRWLLLGAAYEIRFTNLFGLYAEVDTGPSIGTEAGLPFLVRAGASFRL
jgi:hypothetical protein